MRDRFGPWDSWSKLVGVNEEYYGLHDIKDFKVIVSSGMAGWGIRSGQRGRQSMLS